MVGNTNKTSAAYYFVQLFKICRKKVFTKRQIDVSNQMGNTELVVTNRGQLANSSDKTMFILCADKFQCFVCAHTQTGTHVSCPENKRTEEESLLLL